MAEPLFKADPTDKLSQFADWYLCDLPNMPMKPPTKDCVAVVEGVSGVVLWRDGDFQVQMFICEPHTSIPAHTHPDVDSYEVHLTGGIDFYINDKLVIPAKAANKVKKDGSSRCYGWTNRVHPHTSHSAKAGANGGAFLSIQHWLNGVKPTSVGENWDGHTMGKKHNESIEAAS